MRIVTIVRHGKSDWEGDPPDRVRQLAARGIRQVPVTGRWIADRLPPLDEVICSPAARAAATWELLSAELPYPPVARVDEALYTSDAGDVLDVLRTFASTTSHGLIVGHNPSLEEAVQLLSGEQVRLVTAARAVLSLDSDWEGVDKGCARLLVAGRPE